MIPVAIILVIVFVWGAVYFFDLLLKSCFNYPYLWFLNKSGIIIGIGQLRWTTLKFNRIFYRWGGMHSTFLRNWFSLGAIVSVCCIIPAIAVMITTAWKQFMQESGQEGSAILQPALPGVNLPLSELSYYLLTLLLCSIIHEAGHALAAIKEDVKLYGFGFLLLMVFPAAFVDLSTEQLNNLTPWQQLRVYCAGVWNNIVLAGLAVLVMLSLPIISVPVFQHGSGVATVFIESHSPLLGAKGLEMNQIITGINDCKITDFNTWYHCISDSITRPPEGVCVEEGIVKQIEEIKDLSRLNNSTPMDCCLPSSTYGLCFSFMSKIHWKEEYACLPVRRLFDKSSVYCDHHDHCTRQHSDSAVCIRHVGESTSRLLQIHRKSLEDVLFIGNPADLYYTVTVTNYAPRTTILTAFIPYAIETFCRYIVAFSSALALLNVLPCYLLDGHHIMESLGEFLLSSCIRKAQTRKFVTDTIVICGSWLLGINMYLGIRSLLS